MGNIIEIFLATVTLVLLIFVLIDYLSYRNWVQIYTAIDLHHYYTIIGKLKTNGIRYRVKTIVNQRGTEMFIDHSGQYEIFVRKEDEHLASHILHKK